ncbi:MAG: hypothetical protein QOH25_2338 [Acidobacteriota bacterium]|jgi:hypothetical protein|nr:hypothetical protein [Acidobacteriota bacterium]
MQRSNHHPRFHFELALSKIMSLLAFKRRAQSAAGKSAAASETDSVQWAQTFWGRRLMNSVSLMIALLCSASIVLADVKITTKSTAGGQSITSTTYIKGARQRTEGMGYTSIYQCDLKRMIQINDKIRSYLIVPLGDAAGSKGANSQRSGAPARRGGVVTYTTTTTDTGERREMLGLTARHLKSKTVVAASEGACSPMNMEMETDGWYIDLPGGLSCATDGSAAPQFPVEQSDCVDEVRFKTEGTAKPGYPVMTTTRMKFNAGADSPAMNIPTSSSTQEVVDLSNGTLDAALFDIPAGYREVKSMQELGSPY